ncbi:MAG TPA: phage baseplate assembly protein V [Caldilineaceae bacterium]|nr:phage baseplate assembly protein V [Caldilineaceae bacterium]
MQNLYETIRRIVQQELRQVRTAELAVVQEQHPHAGDSDTDNYACTVVLRNSGLVLAQVPVATQWIGQANIPNVGDLVLVQFLGGDINGPIITGRLYNDEDRPPLNEAGQSVLHLPLGAAESDAVRLTLTSGEERTLNFALGNGLEITLRDDDPVVAILIDGDKGTVQIDRDGAVTIKAGGDVTIESDGNINMKGTEISVEASSQLNLKGGTVNIN